MQRRHERPLRRVNPSGKTVWVARWTDRTGKRSSAGTFDVRGACRNPSGLADCCAQHAIDAAYDRDATPAPANIETVGGYAEKWTDRHPRSWRTDRTYNVRVAGVLNVKLAGRAFRDWFMADVRPREVVDLVDHMLREQGRAATGATAMLSALSAMWGDAIRDDVAHYNPFRDVSVRRNDPRIQKAPRRIRVWSWAQMHELAAAAPGVYGEAMCRALSDCGLRLGEMLPLERGDLRLSGCEDPECRAGDVPHVHVVRTVYQGRVESGTKTTRGKAVPGRVAPVPDRLAEILGGLPPRLDTRALFPSATGRVWQNNRFYKDVWYVARGAVPGMAGAVPHEFRHAWVSEMRAALVDPADAAEAGGHSVETATRHYTHALGRSFEAMREAVGE